MKKTVAYLLVLALLLSVMPFAAFAEEAVTAEIAEVSAAAETVSNTTEVADVPTLEEVSSEPEAAPLPVNVMETAPAENVEAELQEVRQLGDINHDGAVNVKDVTVLRRWLVNDAAVSVDAYAADVDMGGTVDIKDVVILRRFLVGGYGITLNNSAPRSFIYCDAVQGGKLYTDLGKPVFDNYGYYGGGYQLNVWMDGAAYGSQEMMWKIVSGNTEAITPVGSRTEIKMDPDTMCIEMNISKYYIAQIAEVYPAQTDADGDVVREGYVTLKRADSNRLPMGEVILADGTAVEGAFITDAFTAEDQNAYVVYTKAGELVQTLTRAESVTGTAGSMTREVTGQAISFEVDGFAYKVAATAQQFYADYGTGITLWLDPNGNILFAEAVASDKVAYVLNAGQTIDGIYGDVITGAHLLFTDGKTRKVNVFNESGLKYNDYTIAELRGTVVSYSVNSDGEYVLFPLAHVGTGYGYGYTKQITKVVTNDPRLPGSTLTANNGTTFIVESRGRDSSGTPASSYTAYTGLKNVPTVEEAAENAEFVITGVNKHTDITTAEYVFVLGGKTPYVENTTEPVYHYYYGAVTGGEIFAALDGIRFGTETGEYRLKVIAAGAELDEELVKVYAARITLGNDDPLAGEKATTEVYIDNAEKTVTLISTEQLPEVPTGSGIAYVLSAGQTVDGIFGDVSTGAFLLFTDGTTKKVDVYNEQGRKYTNQTAAALKGKVVSYTVNAAGEYVLTELNNANSTTYGYNNRITKVLTNNPNLEGSQMFANDDTKYIVETMTRDTTGAISYRYTIYTGLKNVPTVEERNWDAERLVIAGVNNHDAPTLAEYVFVIGGRIKDTAKASVSVFMRNSSIDTAGTDANNNEYYNTKAVVDGRITTVKMTREVYGMIAAKPAMSAFTNMTTDPDTGYITGLMAAADMSWYVLRFTGFMGEEGLYNNGIITMTGDSATSFSVNADVPVYVFDTTANALTQTTVDAFNTTGIYMGALVVMDSVEKILNNNDIVTAIYVSVEGHNGNEGTPGESYGEIVYTGEEAIDVLTAIGTLPSKKAGSFDPAGPVTRADAARMLSFLLNFGYDVGGSYRKENTFADVAEHPYAGYIGYCTAKGIFDKDMTSFAPETKITYLELAELLLRALGYDLKQEGAAGDANAIWQFAHSLEESANIAGGSVNYYRDFNLFSDMDAVSMTDQVTGKNAAKMILNAMFCTRVTYDESIFVVGNTTYTIKNLMSLMTSIYADYNNAFSVGRKLMRSYVCDDFGRPVTKWGLGGEEIGSYPEAPTLAYTDAITGGQLYTDLGKPAFGAIADNKYRLIAKVDGADRDAAALQEKIVSGNAEDITPVGSRTEVFVDDEAMTITMVTAKYYIAQISGVYAAKIDSNNDVTREAYVTLKKIDRNAIPAGNVEFKDGMMLSHCFITDEFTAADRNVTNVVYTKANNKIQSLARAEVKTGVAGSVKMTVDGKMTSFTLDSVAYNVADTTQAFAADYGTNAAIYLDPNGNILYGEGVLSDDVAYVLSAGQSSDGLYGEIVTGAHLLFTDGTTRRVNVYNENGLKYTYETAAALKGRVVSYTLKPNGEYILTLLNNADPGTYGYNNAITRVLNNNPILDGSQMFANDTTTYIVETTKKDAMGTITYSYDVYTGLKNVPTIEERDWNAERFVVAGVNSRNAPTVAKYVFVIGGRIKDTLKSSVSVYMKNSSTDSAGIDADNNRYYITRAVIDGEIKTVEMTEEVYKCISSKPALTAYTNMTTDAATGYITGLTSAADMYRYVLSFTGFKGEEGLYHKGIITMTTSYGDTSYSVNADVPVYVFDTDANTLTQTTVGAFNTTLSYMGALVVMDSVEKLLNNNDIVTAIYVSIG